MTLGQQQRVFSRNLAMLIQYAYALGYEISMGECYRHPEATWGHERSLHRDRLAADLNLFIGGKYQQSTEAHRKLGEFWETLHELNRWGGRFNDGNHYSMSRGGRA